MAYTDDVAFATQVRLGFIFEKVRNIFFLTTLLGEERGNKKTEWLLTVNC